MSHLAHSELAGRCYRLLCLLNPLVDITTTSILSFSALQPAAWRILEGKALEGFCQKLPGQVN